MIDLTTIALTWCLAWGADKKPQFETDTLKAIRDDITNVSPEIQQLLNLVKELQKIPFPQQIHQLEEYTCHWKHNFAANGSIRFPLWSLKL